MMMIKDERRAVETLAGPMYGRKNRSVGRSTGRRKAAVEAKRGKPIR